MHSTISNVRNFWKELDQQQLNIPKKRPAEEITHSSNVSIYATPKRSKIPRLNIENNRENIHSSLQSNQGYTDKSLTILVSSLQKKNNALKDENTKLLTQVSSLEEEILKLKQQIQKTEVSKSFGSIVERPKQEISVSPTSKIHIREKTVIIPKKQESLKKIPFLLNKDFEPNKQETKLEWVNETVGKKYGLLGWCQKMSEGLVTGQVNNFTSCWRDGFVLCAILSRLKPNDLIFGQVSKLSPLERLEKAFSLAEKIGVERFMEPDELGIDRQSTMTYLSEIYKQCQPEDGDLSLRR